MLKEIILAIIIGALLGFGLTGGYLAINKRNTSNDNPPVITSPTPISNSDESSNSSENKDITIDSLENYDLVDDDSLKLSGTTTSNSTIVITIGEEILDDTSDDQGKFTFDLSLESGLNIIKITVIDDQDNQFENYALVISITDREHENARLYEQIAQKLKAREKVKQRAQVG